MSNTKNILDTEAQEIDNISISTTEMNKFIFTKSEISNQISNEKNINKTFKLPQKSLNNYEIEKKDKSTKVINNNWINNESNLKHNHNKIMNNYLKYYNESLSSLNGKSKSQKHKNQDSELISNKKKNSDSNSLNEKINKQINEQILYLNKNLTLDEISAANNSSKNIFSCFDDNSTNLHQARKIINKLLKDSKIDDEVSSKFDAKLNFKLKDELKKQLINNKILEIKNLSLVSKIINRKSKERHIPAETKDSVIKEEEDIYEKIIEKKLVVFHDEVDIEGEEDKNLVLKYEKIEDKIYFARKKNELNNSNNAIKGEEEKSHISETFFDENFIEGNDYNIHKSNHNTPDVNKKVQRAESNTKLKLEATTNFFPKKQTNLKPNSTINLQTNPEAMADYNLPINLQINNQFSNIMSNNPVEYTIINKINQNQLLNQYISFQESHHIEEKYSLLKAIREQSQYKWLLGEIEANPQIVSSYLFPQLLNNLENICTDSFGNYIVQKMIQYLTDLEIEAITGMIIQNFESLALHNSSTRVIQMLIELKNQKSLMDLEKVLVQHFILLSKNLNGIHIISKFCQCYQKPDMIYKCILYFSRKISTDRNGCCLIQKILEINHHIQLKVSLIKFFNFFISIV